MSFRSVFVALTIAFARIQARFWKLRGKRTHGKCTATWPLAVCAGPLLGSFRPVQFPLFDRRRPFCRSSRLHGSRLATAH